MQRKLRVMTKIHDVQVKTPFQKLLMQSICAFTTLTDLSLTTAHLDRPDNVFDRESTTTHKGAGQFGIFENLLSASQLTQLTIKGHVLGRRKMPNSMAKVLESATALKELSITSDGHHGTALTISMDAEISRTVLGLNTGHH